jgi:hypothetical protein
MYSVQKVTNNNAHLAKMRDRSMFGQSNEEKFYHQKYKSMFFKTDAYKCQNLWWVVTRSGACAC